jgi:2-polyprenyl-3-methyl-5-hydroxy-6-metoxy-1,4-benzoquinol methylase/spore coat polysaccharide biosynthesis predicted glycosyltransferase SpsG
MKTIKTFLVVPSCKAGRGGGHLFRSAALVKDLRAAGAKAWLFSPISPTPVSSGVPGDFWFSGDPASAAKWSFIVLDLFRTPKKEAKAWAALAPLIGIDEGIPHNCFDFLIDLLPRPGKESPNCCAPFLLPLPQNRRRDFPVIGKLAAFPCTIKAIISFGAEDPANLTLKAVDYLKDLYIKGFMEVTAVLGPLRKNNEADRAALEKQGIIVIDNSLPKTKFDFKESLSEYNLLITHFGVSAFEALYARVPVLLMNPGAYHNRLTSYARLPSARLLKRYFRAVKITAAYETICAQSEDAAYQWGLEEFNIPKLAEFLLNPNRKVYRVCPLCGAPRETGRITGRFTERTYRLCSCGTQYMNRLTASPVEYNQQYFFDEYKKQYGKTYLEDFPDLMRAAERRLSHIKALQKKGDHNGLPRLCDIGCAYGPFLDAAREAGFNVLGVDPSREAVTYVNKSMGIPAVHGIFPDCAAKLEKFNGKAKQFDVITLWYVIEHFEQPAAALIRINSLLKTGGILAFSTPSGAGISSRKSLRAFLENSPADHWTIWNPWRTAAILRRYGFALKKRVITGHHPERFPAMGALSKIRLFRFMVMGISRLFGLGDTFEVYAVKTAPLANGAAIGGRVGGNG